MMNAGRGGWASGDTSRVPPYRARGAYAGITFGDLDDRLATYGADVTLDTRADPVFPRDAVFASVAWDGLDPRETRFASRLRLDARGYIGLVGQSVLSVRWQYDMSNASLPPYEKFLLGGASTLRGYRAGSFAGDNLMAATAEVRIPLTSPLGVSRVGLNFFGDIGSAYDRGTDLSDTRFRVGGGAGFFIVASIFKLNFDVGPGGRGRAPALLDRFPVLTKPGRLDQSRSSLGLSRIVIPAHAGIQYTASSLRRTPESRNALWLNVGIRRHDEDTLSEPCSDVRAHTSEIWVRTPSRMQLLRAVTQVRRCQPSTAPGVCS
jgi:hypothetical protein